MWKENITEIQDEIRRNYNTNWRIWAIPAKSLLPVSSDIHSGCYESSWPGKLYFFTLLHFNPSHMFRHETLSMCMLCGKI